MGQDKTLEDLLKDIDHELKAFHADKQRSVETVKRGKLTIEKLSEKIISSLGPKLSQYPAPIIETVLDQSELEKAIRELAKEKNSLIEEQDQENPYADRIRSGEITLNMDMSVDTRDKSAFFLTKNEYRLPHSGEKYLRMANIQDVEAYKLARAVFPQYSPRSEKGVTLVYDHRTKEEYEHFNSYIPPSWEETYKANRGNLPNALPPLFKKLVYHLFPLLEERSYFFHWLYRSLFDRAMVYLVLCGAPGTGKNRLKLVMRALHGHWNTIDGKKSTFTDRFNSQWTDSTLVWFDELKYDISMENTMKEIQNDTISIERKGVDATRSTKIYSSVVISNNKPRDNYLAFDARKFAPLLITQDRLEKSMKPEEIDELTRKVEDPDSPDFDIEFLQQIIKWLRYNAKEEDRWPNLEYKGPMFYRLAHTSMSRWQKAAVSYVMSTKPEQAVRLEYDNELGFKWASLLEFILSKKGRGRPDMFPDNSSIQHFFESFVDGEGKKVFKTSSVKGDIQNDFWVKQLADVKIFTENDFMDDLLKEAEGEMYEEDEDDKKSNSSRNSKKVPPSRHSEKKNILQGRSVTKQSRKT